MGLRPRTLDSPTEMKIVYQKRQGEHEGQAYTFYKRKEEDRTFDLDTQITHSSSPNTLTLFALFKKKFGTFRYCLLLLYSPSA